MNIYLEVDEFKVIFLCAHTPTPKITIFSLYLERGRIQGIQYSDYTLFNVKFNVKF